MCIYNNNHIMKPINTLHLGRNSIHIYLDKRLAKLDMLSLLNYKYIYYIYIYIYIYI